MRCADCGTFLFTEVSSAGLRSLNAYLLPKGSFAPQFHIRCAHAVMPVVDDLPQLLAVVGDARADLAGARDMGAAAGLQVDVAEGCLQPQGQGAQQIAETLESRTLMSTVTLTNGVLAIDAERRINAAGWVDPDGAAQAYFFAARALHDGSLDASFDGNGVRQLAMPIDTNTHARAYAVALSGGRPVLAGTLYDVVGSRFATGAATASSVGAPAGAAAAVPQLPPAAPSAPRRSRPRPARPRRAARAGRSSR